MSRIGFELVVLLLSVNYAVGREARPTLPEYFPSIRSLIECRFCELLVYEIQNSLEEWTAEIVNTVIRDCEDVTRFIGVDCAALVNNIIPNIAYLLQKLGPLEICEDLQICNYDFFRSNDTITGNSSGVNWDLGRKEELHNGVGEEYICPACEGAVGFLHDTASREDTWPYFIKLLNSTCHLATPKGQCIDFVNHMPSAGGKRFADKYLNKDAVCKLLGFCQVEGSLGSSKASLGSMKDTGRARRWDMRNTSYVMGSARCELCDGLSRVGQKIINSHTGELLDLLRNRFAGICKQLTSSLQSECNREVSDVLPPILLEIIRDAIDPKILCVYIVRCSE